MQWLQPSRAPQSDRVEQCTGSQCPPYAPCGALSELFYWAQCPNVIISRYPGNTSNQGEVIPMERSNHLRRISLCRPTSSFSHKVSMHNPEVTLDL